MDNSVLNIASKKYHKVSFTKSKTETILLIQRKINHEDSSSSLTRISNLVCSVQLVHFTFKPLFKESG